MNGRIHAWMDGCMHGWMDAWMHGWMHGRMHGWMHGCMDPCMDGCMHGCMSTSRCFSCFAVQHAILHDHVCFKISEQRPSTALMSSASRLVALPPDLIAPIISAPSLKVAALLRSDCFAVHRTVAALLRSDCFAVHRTLLHDQVFCFGFAKHSNNLHKTNHHDNSRCPCDHTT